jgi:drug/metabolite transporter (DMT)-like permease
MRFLLAGSILWIIIFFQKNYPPFSKPALRIYFQFGVLNLAISYGLTYWATQYIYSSLSSIIWSGFPLTVALFSYFMLPNEILTKKKVLSLALGSIGAASILIESINLSGENVTIGVVLVILAVIIASYPSVYLKKYNQIVSSLHINSVSQLMAGIILLSVSYFIEND